MTFFYSILDLEEKILRFSSASHPSCYVWRPSEFTYDHRGQERKRPISELNIPGSELGDPLHQARYQTNSQQLQKDDVILWYTDGLVENKNEQGEEFGKRRLKNLLKSCENLSASAIKDLILKEAYQHYGSAPRADDVTLIVGKMR